MSTSPELPETPKLPATARTEIADAGAGSFRSVPDYRPAAAPAVRRRPLAPPVVPVAALCLLGVLGLYLKFEIMGPQWSLAARLYGGTGGELGGLERLGFYFNDLLLNFIVVPLAGALLAWRLPPRWRTVFFAAGAVLVTLLYFLQLRAQAEIGQYVSLRLLAESVLWAANNPGAVDDYLSLGSVLKLAAFFFLLLFLFAGEYLFSPAAAGLRGRLAPWFWRAAAALAGGMPATALLLLPFAYAHYPARTEMHQSAVLRMAAALLGGEVGSGIHFDATVPQLLAEFRRQTGTPPFAAHDSHVGREEGADVLLFVLETTPAAVFDLVGAGQELPGIGRLYRRSFLGEKHFSTYPYTSDAVYSLLSGLYPQGRRRLLESTAVDRLPGLMSALDPRHYERAVYAPDLYGAEVDDRMYRVFGADRAYYAAADAGGAARAQAAARADRLLADWERRQPPFKPATRQELATRLTLDLQALEKLKSDIVATKKAGRRFCALFLPQIGHGPWLDLHGRDEVAARGHDLALLQDRWLAEIVDLLAANGWLDDTVVVVTADHGIRTRAEDPELDVGKISSYMLQVPLLIHAPQTLQQPVFLSAPTSHIDVAPTVLALLGATEGSASMQGIPVWQRTAAGRIFVLASQYAGADGYRENDTYYMHHLLSDAVFASDRLDFADADLLPPQDDANEVVRHRLRQAHDLQISLVRRLIHDGQPLRTAAADRTAGVRPPMR